MEGLLEDDRKEDGRMMGGRCEDDGQISMKGGGRLCL